MEPELERQIFVGREALLADLNGFWHTDVPTPYVGLSRADRARNAVAVLKQGGWTWQKELAWDEESQIIVAGEGVRMPNGDPMPELEILGPGPSHDPLRATFNQWLSEWLRELGMPVESKLTGLNMIAEAVGEFDFDMFILGWSLTPSLPDYLYDFFHSREDLALGGLNMPGYSSSPYDALADEFIATVDIERARELAMEMQQILAEDRPCILLFTGQVTDFLREDVQLPYTQVAGGIANAFGFTTDARPLLH